MLVVLSRNYRRVNVPHTRIVPLSYNITPFRNWARKHKLVARRDAKSLITNRRRPHMRTFTLLRQRRRRARRLLISIGKRNALFTLLRTNMRNVWVSSIAHILRIVRIAIFLVRRRPLKMRRFNAYHVTIGTIPQ